MKQQLDLCICWWQSRKIALSCDGGNIYLVYSLPGIRLLLFYLEYCWVTFCFNHCLKTGWSKMLISILFNNSNLFHIINLLIPCFWVYRLFSYAHRAWRQERRSFGQMTLPISLYYVQYFKGFDFKKANPFMNFRQISPAHLWPNPLSPRWNPPWRVRGLSKRFHVGAMLLRSIRTNRSS